MKGTQMKDPVGEQGMVGEGEMGEGVGKFAFSGSEEMLFRTRSATVAGIFLLKKTSHKITSRGESTGRYLTYQYRLSVVL